MTIHFIQEDLESWDGGLLTILEAEYILWAESRMDDCKQISPQDEESP